MLKQTIKYNDYNGLEREEDFYFNLTEAELLKLEAGTTGGFTEMVKKIVQAKDTPAIMEVFDKLLRASYGEKSLDGKRFVKNDELTEAFSQTEAYSQLFVKLATDADAASAFVNGILPQSIQDRLAEEGTNVVALPTT